MLGAVPIATVESLIEGGRAVDFTAGSTMYSEADADRLAVIMRGLLRVDMHAGDGRQVTLLTLGGDRGICAGRGRQPGCCGKHERQHS